MQDNDIIKALEHCQVDKSCKGCPSQGKFGKDAMCPHLNRLAVDLINRQKAEIKRLQKAIKVQDIMIEQQDYKIKSAKSEARKEFTERVVSRYAYKLYEKNGKPTSDRAILVSDMKNLLAEMESERG